MHPFTLYPECHAQKWTWTYDIISPSKCVTNEAVSINAVNNRMAVVLEEEDRPMFTDLDLLFASFSFVKDVVVLWRNIRINISSKMDAILVLR